MTTPICTTSTSSMMRTAAPQHPSRPPVPLTTTATKRGWFPDSSRGHRRRLIRQERAGRGCCILERQNPHRENSRRWGSVVVMVGGARAGQDEHGKRTSALVTAWWSWLTPRAPRHRAWSSPATNNKHETTSPRGAERNLHYDLVIDQVEARDLRCRHALGPQVPEVPFRWRGLPGGTDNPANEGNSLSAYKDVFECITGDCLRGGIGSAGAGSNVEHHKHSPFTIGTASALSEQIPSESWKASPRRG